MSSLSVVVPADRVLTDNGEQVCCGCRTNHPSCPEAGQRMRPALIGAQTGAGAEVKVAMPPRGALLSGRGRSRRQDNVTIDAGTATGATMPRPRMLRNGAMTWLSRPSRTLVRVASPPTISAAFTRNTAGRPRRCRTCARGLNYVPSCVTGPSRIRISIRSARPRSSLA